MGATSIGLTRLIADFEYAAEHAVEESKKVVGQACSNIKKNAQRIIRANSPHGYLPHYPRSITYKVTANGITVTGEVGPESTKLQGGLGGLLEYGSVNNAPIPHLSPALDIEESKIVDPLEEMGVRLLEGQPGPGGPVIDPDQ